MAPKEEIVRKPNLSALALAAFIGSFVVARTFTTLKPATSLFAGGLHIHHFWYGIAMLTVGGWLGISYNNERIDRLAAIVFGAGGGLIGDEVGLLLTFEDYWTTLTYTLVVPFLALASISILFIRHSAIIRREFFEFSSRHVALYSGVFLAAVSIAFIIETENLIVLIGSGMLAIVAFTIIAVYFMQRIGMRRMNRERSY